MSTDHTRSETLGDVEGNENVTLEECLLLRLLAKDFHYGARELADVVGRRPEAIRKHVGHDCGHGGRFW